MSEAMRHFPVDGVRIFTDESAPNCPRLRIVDSKTGADVPSVTACDIRIRPDEIATATITTFATALDIAAQPAAFSGRQIWELVKELESDYAALAQEFGGLLCALSRPEARAAIAAGNQAVIAQLWICLDRAKAKLEARA